MLLWRIEASGPVPGRKMTTGIGTNGDDEGLEK